jgi:N-acetylglucosaminyldiphosphoundecaprenol N-acetyl-beta-D-mannosaminyltransferase
MEQVETLSTGYAASLPHPVVGHDYADVLGIRVSAVNLELALHLAEKWIDAGQPGYVCLSGVHGVMEAQKDPELREIMNRAALNLPDGMPMTWLGWRQGFSAMDRVFGPDFMIEMCRLSSRRGYRCFFYGGKPGVAVELASVLRRRIPGLDIVGTYAPPFRPLSPEEERDLFAQIARAKPHVVWVGLSTPKQERFMAQYLDRLQVPLLIGVGAAFDYHTGRIRDCPAWIKRAGLQWLHRLIQEPRRLWKRYLLSNSGFLWRLARQKAHG